MRIRTRVMFASSLLAVGLVAVAPSAYATEGDFSEEQVEEITKEAEEIAEQNGASGFDAECIAILMEGGSPEDCHEAPSPIFPATDELVWGSLSFLVLFLLMRKYAFPSIKKGMNDRSDRIRSDLDAAEQAKSEAAELLDGYRVQMADAQSEAGRIIDEARQTAEALKKDAAARLQTELAETRSRAATDIEAAKVQATADLKGELATLAVGAASAVVNKNLDPATQTQLIEDYIASVGAS
ncbi:MAG: ATP synthase F0 subunit B [Acidimicrobiia bacterium]|nr:ATP synthase F0 subunit B [Acidimicrobiia bacterium]